MGNMMCFPHLGNLKKVMAILVGDAMMEESAWLPWMTEWRIGTTLASTHLALVYPLVMTNSLLLKMAIDGHRNSGFTH